MTIQNAFGRLRRVYVRPPSAAASRMWHAFAWKAQPDPTRAAAEHAAFRSHLQDVGAEVVLGTDVDSSEADPNPDAIYAYDPVLMTDEGAILLRPGKPRRRGEPEAVARDLRAAGLRVAGSITEPAVAEGGDMFWLDERTLLVGLGYRTDEAGVSQLRDVLGPEIELVTFDLPHLQGPDECIHLMSFVSLLDVDLAVAYPPLMPVRLVGLLRDRGVRLIEVPDDEFPTMGPNVLALAPRIALALEGNPETKKRMEAAGVDVRTYVGEEISRKGDGGPTCLTRPLDRADVPTLGP